VGWTVFFPDRDPFALRQHRGPRRRLHRRPQLGQDRHGHGFAVLVIWEYATLFATGFLGTPKEPA
jgi:hypothetical protein